jgi:class 3 adenylate cyclase
MMIPTVRELGGSGAFAIISLLVECGLGEQTNKGVFLMTRQRHDNDDDGNVRYHGDGRGPLRDGERLRTPLHMMDAMQRDVARYAARVTDAMGDTGLALRKPGFRVSDALQRDLSIYDQYDEEVSRLWENPPPGAGSSGPRGEVACALALDEYAEAFRARCHKKGIALGITRIGVHAGPAIVGNFGGGRFFDYTAYGDTINVAARLEAANKQLGMRICASATLAARVEKF